ncbi:uncharacterized protein TEOVI_000558100 [Trypanosoma equiperdum]|uniref:Membrane-associated protein n=4 Tax=Trypanozoon TaxID=39700 RepID=Q584F5_TRYB2|nr:hypothetical protein, conserved [Trypanosoma brucei gambiense DAL972]XP_844382.1 hypothetical protein, conserved [Trypanosoma brucei brucei TREU927]AAX79050.1 hypothetical protein, conserved [Trypanosoma brucei]RHW73063.1 hypothetical protein DPX39_040026200 [Trypanosoma brucei equiperdum]SCU66187.1 hypothetical protein, conserved [Trypanosoma equiperdum]AAZ10823.1 hypothetical protein, conserved [Trypanosoma brucei brucei TREU927]CBH10526.1 hypothetical protein, conserved [Trypanosoma bru|eukprot:XP_011772815.1 hypothetical protein, conserved [Trypanosoma brucei gambiense DAL972]
MVVFHQLILPLGVLLLLHSIYLALSAREQLQEQHHGTGESLNRGDYFPMTSLRTGAVTGSSGATLYIFAELLVGVAVSIIGYVKRSTFKPARLIDKNCFDRYDSIAYTGVGFMHFNHRGAGTARRSAKTPNGESIRASTGKKHA